MPTFRKIAIKAVACACLAACAGAAYAGPPPQQHRAYFHASLCRPAPLRRARLPAHGALRARQPYPADGLPHLRLQARCALTAGIIQQTVTTI